MRFLKEDLFICSSFSQNLSYLVLDVSMFFAAMTDSSSLESDTNCSGVAGAREEEDDALWRFKGVDGILENLFLLF
jgi:hypothetical protein